MPVVVVAYKGPFADAVALYSQHLARYYFRLGPLFDTLRQLGDWVVAFGKSVVDSSVHTELSACY